MRRYLGIALVIGISLFALNRIRLSLRSPSERLHHQVAKMVRAFNDAKPRQVTRHFHPNFVDATSGADRGLVRQGIYSLQWEHSRNQKFMLEFQWVEPFEPNIDEASGTATGEAKFRIVDKRIDPPRVWWESPVQYEFVYEGGGWLLSKTHKTAAQPGR